MPDAVASTSLNELTRSSEAQKCPMKRTVLVLSAFHRRGRPKGGATLSHTARQPLGVAESGFESQVVRLQCPELGVHLIPPVTAETCPLAVLI